MKATTELWKAASSVRVSRRLPEASSAAAEVPCKDCLPSMGKGQVLPTRDGVKVCLGMAHPEVLIKTLRKSLLPGFPLPPGAQRGVGPPWQEMLVHF